MSVETNLPGIDLGDQQRDALEAIRTWYDSGRVRHRNVDDRVFRLFGYAGTGKTTVARLVPELLGLPEDRVLYAAYTGKAVHVLRTKGCPNTTTLHSLLQTQRQSCADQRLGRPCRDAVPGCETCEKQDKGDGLCPAHCVARHTSWRRNDESALRGASLLVCDEVSMVDERLGADITSFGVPVIVLGDPAQLPPVGGGGHFTKSAPDVLLTEVHRQAEGSAVLDLATRIRTSRTPGSGLRADDYRTSVDYSDYDQVLCWTRDTRWNAVKYLRRQAGRQAGIPGAGDTVICLQNNKDIAVFNGQMWTVLDATGGVDDASGQDVWHLRLTDDNGDVVHHDAYAEGFLGREEEEGLVERRLGARGETATMTFAQALTVHKAQGSEWDNVLVVDEVSRNPRCRMSAKEQRRWLYTAVTRASRSVTLRPAKPVGR